MALLLLILQSADVTSSVLYRLTVLARGESFRLPA
jgi:hypothetical protein